MGVPVLAVSNVTGEGIDAFGRSSAAQDDRPARLLGRREVVAREPARGAR